MCMKYVNAIVRAYYDIREENDEIIAFIKPFDHARVPVDKDGRRIMPAFKVAVNINILGTLDKENKANPIIEGKTLFFRLNMTQFNSDRTQRRTEVLDLFEIDLSKARYYTACYEFLNTTRIVSVPSMTLPEGSGRYALKLFVTEKKGDMELESLRYSNEFFTIQCMSEIHFEAADHSASDA